MAKKVKVDRDLCIGCGTCPSICPKVFVLDAEGKSTVIKKGETVGVQDWVSEENCDDTPENIQMAADSCPTRAILIEEEAVASA